MSGNGITGASAIRTRRSNRTSIFKIILLEKDMEKGLEMEMEEGRGRGRNVSVSLVSTLSLSLFCLKSTFIFLSTHVQEGGRRGRGTKSSVHQGGAAGGGISPPGDHQQPTLSSPHTLQLDI